jgi:hypothetical protein
MLMGAHNGAVDKDLLEIGVTCQMREQTMPYPEP